MCMGFVCFVGGVPVHLGEPASCGASVVHQLPTPPISPLPLPVPLRHQGLEGCNGQHCRPRILRGGQAWLLHSSGTREREKEIDCTGMHKRELSAWITVGCSCLPSKIVRQLRLY